MTEQIYINGVLMEQGAGSPASLVWQSPFFTDIDSITSDRSNSVDFPPTRNNLAAIGNCHLAAVDSVYAYRKHRVLYCRDGVQVFAGYATLLSITPTAVRFTFTWGSVEAFQTLLDLNLRDLTGETMHVTWADGQMGRYANDNIWWGADGVTPHPVMPVSEVLDAMQEASGVKFANADIFADYVIPLVAKEASTEESKAANGLLCDGTDTAWLYPTGTQSSYAYRFICLTGTALGMDVEGGVIDVGDFDGVKLTAEAGLAFRTRWRDESGTRQWCLCDLIAYAVTEDGDDPVEIGRVATVQYDEDDEYRYYMIAEAAELTLDVSAYSYLILSISQNYATELISLAYIFPEANFAVRLWPTDDQDVAEGGLFPLWGNLPDWTCSQLLKNLMKIEGVFPLVKGATEVEFISIDALYDNRAAAPDWTDRLMLTGGMAEEISTALDGYARSNTFRWAEDETVTGDYDGAMEVDDETLDREAELVTMDFAATDTGSDGRAVIRSYSVDEGDEDAEVEFDEVEPRILRLDGDGRAVFTGLEWPTILENKYDTYRRTVDRPRLLTVQVLVDALTLAALDLTVPVYFRQFGHYYAIRELTTKDARTAEAKLLELGNIDNE